MSILPSFASFRASMARWAPPSLEKRMKPCNRELHCQHNSVKNTPSFARIFSWQTQNHKRNFSLGRLIGRLWLAQIWQFPRLSKLNVDSDQKVYYSWLFSGITLRQFWGHLIICDSRRWSYYARAQYSIIVGQYIADHADRTVGQKKVIEKYGVMFCIQRVNLCVLLLSHCTWPGSPQQRILEARNLCTEGCSNCTNLCFSSGEVHPSDIFMLTEQTL